MKTWLCFFTMKLQESNARAQRSEQQKAVNTLDITASGHLQASSVSARPGNLTHIFLPQAATSHSAHYNSQLQHNESAQPLLCAETPDQQSVRKFQSVTASDCKSQSTATYLLPKLRSIILIVEVRVEYPGKVRDIPL